jgi:hypothetical protein
MAGHNNKVLHFYQGVFSCTNTVPLYRLPFQNDATNVMTLACEKYVHCCTHTSIQRHKNLRNQVSQVTTVGPTICGCSVQNLLHVTLPATRIVGRLPNFGKIMHPCPIWWKHLKLHTKHIWMCILHFTHCHIFGQKVAMTCGSDPCITNRKMIIIIHQLNMSPCMLMELLYQNFNTIFAPLAWIHFHNKMS